VLDKKSLKHKGFNFSQVVVATTKKLVNQEAQVESKHLNLQSDVKPPKGLGSGSFNVELVGEL